MKTKQQIELAEEIKAKMQKEICEGDIEDFDREMPHIRADNLLCELLIKLGFEDVVEVYHKVPKWFA